MPSQRSKGFRCPPNHKGKPLGRNKRLLNLICDQDMKVIRWRDLLDFTRGEYPMEAALRAYAVDNNGSTRRGTMIRVAQGYAILSRAMLTTAKFGGWLQSTRMDDGTVFTTTAKAEAYFMERRKGPKNKRPGVHRVSN